MLAFATDAKHAIIVQIPLLVPPAGPQHRRVLSCLRAIGAWASSCRYLRISAAALEVVLCGQEDPPVSRGHGSNEKNYLALRHGVLSTLDGDPRLDSRNIGVALNNRVVALRGHLGSLAERQAAQQATGVSRVIGNLSMRPSSRTS